MKSCCLFSHGSLYHNIVICPLYKDQLVHLKNGEKAANKKHISTSDILESHWWLVAGINILFILPSCHCHQQTSYTVIVSVGSSKREISHYGENIAIRRIFCHDLKWKMISATWCKSLVSAEESGVRRIVEFFCFCIFINQFLEIQNGFLLKSNYLNLVI